MELAAAAILGLMLAGLVWLVAGPWRGETPPRREAGRAMTLADPDAGPWRDWYAERAETADYWRFLGEIYAEVPAELLILNRDWPVAQALGHAFEDRTTEVVHLTIKGYKAMQRSDHAQVRQ